MFPNLDIAHLGLVKGTVELVDGDQRWASCFELLATALRASLVDSVAAIEHVGSTAVAALTAKPIIDVAVLQTSDGRLGEIGARLERLGFTFRGNQGSGGGLLFVLESEPLTRIAHLHLIDHDDVTQWSRYLRFRDLLRTDADLCRRYTALKQGLAKQHPDDRAAYTAGKSSFIDTALTTPLAP